jgi:hypothetical protein
MAEIYFDLQVGGCIEGYPGQYGAGRVFFDSDTREFLRIEPPGGYSPDAHGERVAPPVDTLVASLHAPDNVAIDTQVPTVVNGG